MRGYLLPLVKRYVEGDIPSKDFLCRQWERFRPIGAPTPMPCTPPDGTGVDVIVNLMYRDGPSLGGLMIADFQSQPSKSTSSSGGTVTFTNLPDSEAFEVLAIDQSTTNGLTWTGSDPMNAITLGRNAVPPMRFDQFLNRAAL